MSRTTVHEEWPVCGQFSTLNSTQVLERIPDYKINRIDELLPRNCASTEDREADA